jgi:hypothetical protein
VTRRIPALLNAISEIATNKMDEEAEPQKYLILVPHNAAIAIITTMPVDQILT